MHKHEIRRYESYTQNKTLKSFNQSILVLEYKYKKKNGFHYTDQQKKLLISDAVAKIERLSKKNLS